MSDMTRGDATSPPSEPGTGRRPADTPNNSFFPFSLKGKEWAIALLLVLAAAYYGYRFVVIAAVALDKGVATAELSRSERVPRHSSDGGFQFYRATFRYEAGSEIYPGKAEFRSEPEQTFEVYYSKMHPRWNFVPGSYGVGVDVVAGCLVFMIGYVFFTFKLKSRSSANKESVDKKP